MLVQAKLAHARLKFLTIGFPLARDQMRMGCAEDDIGEVRMAFDELRQGCDHDLDALVR